MSLRGVGIVVGGATLGAGGLYYIIHLEKLAGLEYEEKEVRKKTEKYKVELTTIDKDVQETNALLKTLEQQAEVQRRASAAVRTQLEAARQEVVGLEQELLGKEAEIKVTLQNASSAQTKLRSLREDMFRTKEHLSLGEKTLMTVQARVAETKSYLNPLNHPTVKELLNRK